MCVYCFQLGFFVLSCHAFRLSPLCKASLPQTSSGVRRLSAERSTEAVHRSGPPKRSTGGCPAEAIHRELSTGDHPLQAVHWSHRRPDLWAHPVPFMRFSEPLSHRSPEFIQMIIRFIIIYHPDILFVDSFVYSCYPVCHKHRLYDHRVFRVHSLAILISTQFFYLNSSVCFMQNQAHSRHTRDHTPELHTKPIERFYDLSKNPIQNFWMLQFCRSNTRLLFAAF